MNIGVDIKCFKNGATGISKYVRRILDELQLIDSKNRYYLMECKPSDYAPVNPLWEKISQNIKTPGTLWLQTAVPKLIRKYGIDVFWAPEQIAPVFGLAGDVKIIATVHDFTFLRYPKTCRFSDLMIQKLLFEKTVRASAAIIPVSDYVKGELMRFYPYLGQMQKIIRTVTNGADEPPKTSGGRIQRDNFLFFPGNMEPRKNLFRLIEAVKLVNEAGFDIALRLCGPTGWKNKGLKKLMGSGSVKEHVKHIGYIDDEELTNQYLTCKALVYPSIYEGFGIPVLEALMLDTPVLTSKGTVMEEIAGGNAMYFDPLDVGSIADAIIRFLKSGAVSIDKEALKKYSWRKSAEVLLEVFGELKSKSLKD